MNKERLLNVAKALRESPKPEEFCMSRYGNECGTPACALGHYSARNDLQSEFTFDPKSKYGAVKLASTGDVITHSDFHVADHFDLTKKQVSQVFGCEMEASAELYEGDLERGDFLALAVRDGRPVDAAEWIESFVAANS